MIAAASFALASVGLPKANAQSEATSTVAGGVQLSGAQPEWLNTLNAYRRSVGLSPVVLGTNEVGVQKHATYTALNNVLIHTESESAPGYSPEGAAAAAKSVVTATFGRISSDRQLIETWMATPFHTIHLLEPRLQSAAYATARDVPGSRFTVTAVLDVFSGLLPRLQTNRPVVFPGDKTTVPLTSFDKEAPDPLTACPGYSSPAGLPILMMFPNPPIDPAFELMANGSPVETCLITGSGYVNPESTSQATGRTLLTQKNAVVAIPRSPLVPGTSYQAKVRTSAGTNNWTFSVTEENGPLPQPSSDLLVTTEITRPQRTTTTAAPKLTSSKSKSTPAKKKTTTTKKR